MTDIQYRNDIKVSLVQSVGNDESICRAAWISSGALLGEDATVDKQRGLIRALLRGHHGTPFEHASMTFLVEAPLFVFREWHRHRIGWSYNEASARYKKKMEPIFWVPKQERPLIKEGKGMAPKFLPGTPQQYASTDSWLRSAYEQSWACYEGIINSGIANEVARAALPVGLYSSMYATCNPRSLMHFLSLRTHEIGAKFVSYPQLEIEEGARQMENIFAEKFPLTFAAYNEFGRVAP